MIYATEILHKAGNLITGSRKETHGDFVENHKNIAKLWSATWTFLYPPFKC